MTAEPDRNEAVERDLADPLRSFRPRFTGLGEAIDAGGDGLIYLDGNSLGRLPASAITRVHEVVESEWGRGLVTSWGEGANWIEEPTRVGDLLGVSLLGAAPGQVLISDSTTVNFYKLATAALDARPGRTAIVTDLLNFPTDRYVLEGLAAARGLTLVPVAADPVDGVSVAGVAAALDSTSALVALSHVDYRSGALADLAGITAAVHDGGALMLWDLAHSVGSVPVGLDAAGVDLAVGCTYKYLDAGPGSPAFLYVRAELQSALRQPIWGWFGQSDQFAMGPEYRPVEGIGRFATGTPSAIGLALVDEGVTLLAEAGIGALRAKGQQLTSYLVELVDAWLSPLGVELASPRDPELRGSHISLRHPDGFRICRAMMQSQVIPDFRAPDLIRLGCSPLTTSFVEVHDAMARLRKILASNSYLQIEQSTARVT
jgi:kynureninase